MAPAWRRPFLANHKPLRRPAGKTRQTPVNASRSKYFALREFGIVACFGHPDPAEGRIAIVTNAGWDVVDAGGVAAKVVAGRVTP